MANYFVDTALGTGADDGSSMDAAQRGTDGIKTAMEFDHAEGTLAWFRRTCAYDEGVVALNADIAPTADGTAPLPVYFIAWPRAAIPNTTITEASWTNGSTTVDLVVGVSLTRTGHQARWCTAPNGKKYFITRVVDSNTFNIDREYVGSSVTGTNGLFQIDQDDYYDLAQAIDDSAWTIKKADWNADAHDLPTIDFNNEAYQLALGTDTYLIFSGFNFIDSADTLGIINPGSGCCYVKFENCLFKQNSNNTPVVYGSISVINLKNFTIEGSGAGAAQHGFGANFSAASLWKLTNGAIYNCGANGIYLNQGNIELKNVNVGVEIANASNDISCRGGGMSYKCFDVKLGGTNGYVTFDATSPGVKIAIENYGKVLGAHKAFYAYLGSTESIAVTATNANKKLSDTVIKVLPSLNNVFSVDDFKNVILDAAFELGTGSQTIRFWIFNDLGQTLNDTTARDNVYLKATYVDTYDDTTEYSMLEAFSTQIDIADAASADDWDYLEVTVNPAVASKVRVQFICTAYDATDYFLIDPKPVIS